MKLNHPNFPSPKQKDTSAQSQPMVHTVMPPEDEAFMSQMTQVIQAQGPQEPLAPIVNDVLLQEQIAKKAVLEKLVLFKEPHYKEVVIKDVTFRLKLVNAEENTKVYRMIRKLPEEDRLTGAALVLLAAALVDANGVKIEDTYDGPVIDDPVTKKYHELKKWHMPIINALSTAYQQFSAKVESEYSQDFLDKSPQTPSTD